MTYGNKLETKGDTEIESNLKDFKDTNAPDKIDIRKQAIKLLRKCENDIASKKDKLLSSNSKYFKSFDGNALPDHAINEYERLACQLNKEIREISFWDHLTREKTIIAEIKTRIQKADKAVKTRRRRRSDE